MLCTRFLSTLAGVLLSAAPALAADLEQMAFLHLRWQSNSISLLSSEVRTGRLKKSPTSLGALRVHLADAQGRSLWQSSMEDPRVRRYEYPAGEDSKTLRTKTVTETRGECVIRVPVRSDAAEVLILSAATSRSPALAGISNPVLAGLTNGQILARFPAPRPPSKP